ncbi:MAG: glycine cleavage T C-terminal barrel domain-containing protein [Acidimicrobiales bacterium]
MSLRVPRGFFPGAPEVRFDEDYDALRHSVGALVLERNVVRVAGIDALEYLQGQCSQDLIALESGASVDALLLSPRGKLDALVRVTRLGHEELLVDVDAGYGDAVKARLERFKLRVKAEIEPVGWHCLALRGPGTSAVLAGRASGSGTSLVLPYEWNGVVGADLLGEAPEVPESAQARELPEAPEVPEVPLGARRCGLEAWESVRVEAGIPAMGAELDERTIAAEAHLLERCVSLTKGCYTGQEIIARLEARGNRVARRLRGLVIAEPPSGVTVLPRGSEVRLGEKVVGSVTSSAWSPTLGAVCALGYLHRDVTPPCPVEVHVPMKAGATHALPAEARSLPLVV